MIHPDSEIRFVSPAIGYGVFAHRFIPKGTILWVFDDLDQVIPPAKQAMVSPVLQRLLEKYSYQNGRGDRILCWDHGRFVNHSCNPAALAPGFDLELAIRDIQPGEEITDDYGALNIEAAFECSCGFSGCRGTVGPGDFEAYSGHWDALVADAFRQVERVEQPLWELVREQAEIRKVLAGEMPLPSCRAHLLQGPHDRR
ncbi:MAG: SET domain-containing protein-lysine N-methyltransferase [Vicinamibacterales bacterium]